MLHHRDPAADLLDHSHLVGDQHDRNAKRFIQMLQEVQDGSCGLRVQCRCGLVAQQHIGIIGQCSRNGNALLLPAGQLAGIGVRLIANPHKLQQMCDLVRRFFPAQTAAAHGVGYISGDGAGRH